MHQQSEDIYRPVTHCIFDFDGTLIDTECYITEAISSVCERYDKVISWDLRQQILGLHFARSGPIVIRELNLPLRVDDYIREVLDEFAIRINEGCNFMPGAKRLVKHLHNNDIALAICTGSTKFTYSIKVKSFGNFFDEGKYFHHIVKAGDDPDVKRNKPYPDPYNVCINRFNPKPDPMNVLVFEDSPTGVESAITAGLRCVMVPDPRLDKSKCNSTLIIDSLNDFKPEMFGIPKF